MPIEPEPELDPKIAHVLLLDVVGYGKLLVDDQILLLSKLNQIVRQTSQFVAAESAGALKRLPTGDGMALLFFDSLERPPRCALEIAQALKEHPEIGLRMGIHSGPIKEVMDVNDRPNVAGAGVDTAQRVLDCGDAGHILLSGRAADDLKPIRRWSSYLEDLGECEVKHGRRLRIFNLCRDGLGNPSVPSRIRIQRGHLRRFGQALTLLPRWRTLAVVALVTFLALAGLHWLTRGRLPYLTSGKPPSVGRPIPSKSVGVLTFENLSQNRLTDTFTDSVQEEILNNLALIADLKVPGRASVIKYRKVTERNLSEIGQSLGVAHVLQGSVEEKAGRIRILVQLIDAKTSQEIWHSAFESAPSGLGATQTEVAKKVAEVLQARVSPQEKSEIEKAFPANFDAHVLYLKAKESLSSTTFNARGGENLFESVNFLTQAIEKDPGFVAAYCLLARTHDQLYFLGIDHSPTRLARAEAAVQSALRLQPKTGASSLALGEHYYWGYRDYEQARTSIEAASRSLPNDSRPLLLLGYLDRRQGLSEKSLDHFNKARALDPLNLLIFQQMSLSYQLLRRFPEMASILDQALEISPENVGTRVQRALVDLEWKGEAEPLGRVIHDSVANDPTVGPTIANDWLAFALYTNNPEEAARALAVMTPSGCRTEGVLSPKSWCIGVAARARGDLAAARTAFEAARGEAEGKVMADPFYAEAHSALGLIDAGLDRKEEAIREGRKAIDLLPVSKDSIEGAVLQQNLALIYTWVGEKDSALRTLRVTAKINSTLSYGQLQLHPNWQSLRGDPRFEQIKASLAPTETKQP